MIRTKSSLCYFRIYRKNYISNREDSISVRSIDESSSKRTYTLDKRNEKDFNVKTAV